MKPKQLILLILIFCAIQNLSAQMNDGYIYYENQRSPIEYYAAFPHKRPALDSTLSKSYDRDGNLLPTSLKWQYYHKSADGIRGTIVYYYIESPLISNIRVLEYDTGGKLLENNYYDPDTTIGWRYQNAYTYDSLGRVIEARITDRYKKPEEVRTVYYDYTNHSIYYWSLNLDGDSLKSTLSILPINDGYMCYESYYLIDRETGKVREGISDSTQFVYDAHKRLVSWKDMLYGETIRYTYFEDGYARYNAVGLDRKYYYDAKKNLIRKEYYSSTSLNLPYKWDITTYYLKDSTTTSKERVEGSLNRAYGIAGRLVIDARPGDQVKIYSLTGTLVKQMRVTADRSEIPLSKGFYVVTIEQNGFKVLVR